MAIEKSAIGAAKCEPCQHMRTNAPRRGVLQLSVCLFVIYCGLRVVNNLQGTLDQTL